MQSTAIISTRFIDIELKVKIALNDLQEKHESKVKQNLFAAYILSFNQAGIIKEHIAHYFAERITQLLALTPENRATEKAILEIFEFNILKTKVQEADVSVFLNTIVKYNGPDQWMLNIYHRDGRQLLQSFRRQNLVTPKDLEVALRKLEQHKKKLSKQIEQIAHQKLPAQAQILKERHFKSTTLSFISSFIFANLDLESIETKSPLNLALFFVAIYLIQLIYNEAVDVLIDSRKALQNLPFSLIIRKTKRESTNGTSSTSSLKPNHSTEIDFDVKLELKSVDLTSGVQKDTSSCTSTEEQEHPKKSKRSAQTSVATENKLINNVPLIDVKTLSPAYFDERFKDLSIDNMTVIDPENLGKSRHYWGLWNQPAIESNCRSPEDMKSCAKLFTIFKSGELARNRNSAGIKYIANLGLFEIKSKSGPQRVFANDTAAISKGADKLLVFNEFDRKGLH